MNRIGGIVTALVVFVLVGMASAAEPKQGSETWTFAVSGDSRNCGDVVMPAIAADAGKHNATCYWHLGDLRLISAPDQDFSEERVGQGFILEEEAVISGDEDVGGVGAR